MNDCWYADNGTIKYFLQWERSACMPLCVCVSHDTKPFPALHLIPCTQLSAQSRSCAFSRGDIGASLNLTNLPRQAISATHFCSVATIHLPILSTWLAGIVLQSIPWHSRRLLWELRWAENSKASIPSAGGNQSEAV